MKPTLIFAGIFWMTLIAPAALFSTSWTVGATIPDADASGIVSRQTVNAPVGNISLGSLLVSIELTGGWNGDLYGYLSHSSGFAVLLDRVGYSGSGYGYSTAGMNVWLTDGSGLGNIETTPSPVANGPYSRINYAGSLSSFDGLDPNGTWSLFFADRDGGGVSTLQSWGLQMDIIPVPEPSTGFVAAIAGGFCVFQLSRQAWRRKKELICKA